MSIKKGGDGLLYLRNICKSPYIYGLLILLLIINITDIAIAGHGDQAEEPGITGQKPLYFKSITLEDGTNVKNATNIPLMPKLNLKFAKNVVNMVYWENNRNCFTLVDENGENIPIEVTKIDDTVDSTFKRDIFVKPIKALSPETEYFLKISPELRAKNGVSTLGGTTDGKGVTIKFKTVGVKEKKEVVSQNNIPASSSKDKNNDSIQVKPKANEDSTKNKKPEIDEPDEKSIDNSEKPDEKDTQQEIDEINKKDEVLKDQTNDDEKLEKEAKDTNRSNFRSYLLYIALILIVIWIISELYFNFKSKNSGEKK